MHSSVTVQVANLRIILTSHSVTIVVANCMHVNDIANKIVKPVHIQVNFWVTRSKQMGQWITQVSNIDPDSYILGLQIHYIITANN